jgi:hypothetical protein
MFFNPFGIIGGVLSFAGAAIKVAWGVTKLVAKATAKAVKGAIKVGRFLYKHGKPLGRNVIKTIKSCSGAVLSSVSSAQKSHVFTKPEQSSSQPPPLTSPAARAIASRTVTNREKPSASTVNLTSSADPVTGGHVKAVAASVKRSNVFAESSTKSDSEQSKLQQAAPKSNLTGTKVASVAAKAVVAGASIVAPEYVVAAKAGIKTARIVGKVGKGVVKGTKILADAMDKSNTPNGEKP